MRVIKKIVKIGDSWGIILDRIIINNLQLNLGEEVVVDILKDFRKLESANTKS